MQPATPGSWLIIGCLILSLKVAGRRLTVETPAGTQAKFPRDTTSDLSSVLTLTGRTGCWEGSRLLESLCAAAIEILEECGPVCSGS